MKTLLSFVLIAFALPTLSFAEEPTITLHDGKVISAAKAADYIEALENLRAANERLVKAKDAQVQAGENLVKAKEGQMRANENLYQKLLEFAQAIIEEQQELLRQGEQQPNTMNGEDWSKKSASIKQHINKLEELMDKHLNSK